MNKKIVALLAVVLLTGVAYGDPGDVWSLSGDMQAVSNPSPAIDPGALGGGTATWTYTSDGAILPSQIVFGLTVDPAAPDAGVGWGTANAVFLPSDRKFIVARFSVDSDPNSADGDTTNYVIGDVGGFSPIEVTWTTNHTGFFDIEAIGYNATNQLIGTPGLQSQFVVVVDGLLAENRPLTGGVEDGSANAYVINAVVEAAKVLGNPENFENVFLEAGDQVKVQIGNVPAGDWVGFDLTITEVPEAPLCLDENRPAADIDGNCWVDIFDFAKISQDWMDCGIENLPASCFI